MIPAVPCCHVSPVGTNGTDAAFSGPAVAALLAPALERAEALEAHASELVAWLKAQHESLSSKRAGPWVARPEGDGKEGERG